ncbi:hypothetical protein E2K93_03650 [Thalassotalea sp. HSM 43]|uniref:M61 family metallopeptidase n=1 Tax=Thalassotalea sp. HSM 43 TaxID=2552945 RepID=UPI0010821C95|nr:hypothetical protein [Thalassotalea sp. HSM 43]QBY03526.1 hypothetical protein E2K93_03650 [Thalassotalea sp. HSM 43]
MFTTLTKVACAMLCALASASCFAATLNITSNSQDSKQKQKIESWLTFAKTATESTLTIIKQPELPITVSVQRYGTEPVPWGEVKRASRGNEEYDTLNFVVGGRASLMQMQQDWTVYHEMAHLYLPYMDYPSFWMSEGFASYMQNVIMLQAKVYDKQTFIYKIKDGFRRGESNWRRAPGPLAEVSDDMWQKRAFRRVHWSGVAYYLTIDSQLQQQGSSLAKVVEEYYNCCLTSFQRGKNLAGQLDKVSKTKLFSTTFDVYHQREDFPQIDDALINQVANYYQQNKADIDVADADADKSLGESATLDKAELTNAQ